MNDGIARIELRRRTGPSLWAIIDLADLDRVQRHRWHAAARKTTTYAETSIREGGRETTIALHRFIMCPGVGLEVDHHDGDGLNNRRPNLRIATRSENQRNRRAQRDTASIYKGVTWYAAKGRWIAQIKRDGRREYLGSFASELDAALAYDMRARELHLDFALLNFPDEGRRAVWA